MQALETKAAVKVAEGTLSYHRHRSLACDAEMNFAIFIPPSAQRAPAPVLYWLSGLTCTEENFMIKAGALQTASRLGLILVAPDTSPRGLNLAGEHDHWDFGSGAGFYLDATQAPWSSHYRMFEYVSTELPTLLTEHFPVDLEREAISGHSMGGHGALVVALRQPGRYRSISAFAPICAPSLCPWGIKAFGHYLGSDLEAWRAWDAAALLDRATHVPPLLVDQGCADPFLMEQLKPEELERVCQTRGHALNLRYREGYDHSYYFISTFIEEHLAFHHAHLGSVP